jgi:hypothetical protein
MEPEAPPANKSPDARLDSLERAIKDLAAQNTKQKDVWDKLSSLSGLAVALIGATFTFVYNSHTERRNRDSKAAEERLQELRTIGQFMPYLTGKDETGKKYALTAINTLANTTIATELAKLNPSTGVEQGLVAIARQASNTKDRQLAESALTEVRCGIGDWSMKILTDAESSQIDIQNPVLKTVQDLRALKRPPEAGLPARSRRNVRSEFEKKAYVVQGRLTAVKLEASSDYALVLADPDDANATMTARIPSPDCAKESPFREQFLAARKTVNVLLGAEPGTSFKTTNAPVEALGIGYFTQVHGQRGVAPNGFELHPVLSLQLSTTAKTQ